ncbi:Predicted alpha-1,6-mannanase, GH76 family [Chitinophaga costaii]|uniref:Predicted alpha-1,6-mannanase, GH76 family n=1 Tax=Chitinophaga costaii TaxID=1335309 RepID=A0A1C4FA81_9BACT|nr:glycoside hydrolase family 76 protein [Chitinophaga costaii]SCC52800.1 Predicted alpha-1,6-mannanase, GH76 family [Chitinophaga costaii]
MQKLAFLLPLLVSVHVGCSQQKDDPKPSPTNPVTPVKVAFTDKDATQAYNTFNTYFYSPNDKLYYATTEKKDIGAIWTQAVYWDLAQDAYKRTKDPAYLQLVNDIYTGGLKKYDQYNWNNKTVWFIYDDMMWWIVSLARAHQLTGNATYLSTAQAGFQHVIDGSFDPGDGGMFWDFQHSGKNSCITFPTVIAAMTLYNITKDPAYLDKAKTIFNYGRNNLFNNSTGRVADNNINGSIDWTNYTYNYGTFIGAATMLYQQSQDQGYLTDAKKAADYTWHNVSDTAGILPAEGDWNEQGVLKAIFAHYLMNLVNDGGQTQYLPWIRNNINTAWGNRDPSRGLTYRNYNVVCPSGNIQSYEASSAVEFMQVCPPAQ